MPRDLGDFQTPPALVKLIIARLNASDKQWERALEPTCGQGNFILELLQSDTPPCEIQGIELQAHYVEKALQTIPADQADRVSISNQSIFEVNLKTDVHWQISGPLLVIGNPPWVTNSELSSLGSSNLPEKVNLKNLSGLDAMTGSSNFDIAEYIWLKLIKELSNEKATIALLCKTSVARNVLQFVVSKKISISNAAIIKIDAKKWFGVAVDACLFYLDVGSGTPDYEVPVYENLETLVPASTIGFINGQLVSDVKRLDSLNRLDGVSQLNWRQGLKHDAASVIELKIDDLGEYRNKLGQVVEVEKDYIFPFLKSSDLAGKSKVKPQRAVLVPQRRLGEDTSTLVYKAPLLWAYLNQHRNEFEQRKSSIYRNQPPFAFFGLGDYSFASYKVAISGMYKEPVFRLVVSQDKRPVMLDDTCYFLACSSGPQALLITSLLNNPICLDFLHSIAFWDAKRPITKKILQRIDLCALLRYQNISEIIQRIYIELDQLQNILSIEERTQYLTLLQI